MPQVIYEKDGPVACIRLNNGVTNALGPRMLAEFETILDTGLEGVSGVLLTGGSKFFSIGLNLPELIRFDRDEIIDFLARLDSLVLRLMTLPVPVVSAVRGHAAAAGTILAMAADYLVAAPGRRLMGFNEIQIGLPVPLIPDALLRLMTGDRTATRLVMDGQLIPAEDLVSTGIVDEIVAEEDVEKAAGAKLQELMKKPGLAFSVMKENRVLPVIQVFERFGEAQREKMADCWFQPEVQAMLSAALEKFQQRS